MAIAKVFNGSTWIELDAKNADTVDGKHASDFASANHNHDARYYTESEVDSKLAGKANSSHTHTRSQITDFPTTLPASGGRAHDARAIYSVDNRNENNDPQWYMTNHGKTTVVEFKYLSKIGLSASGTYCHLITHTPWTDGSGGYPYQMAYTVDGVYFRRGTGNTAWGSWNKFAFSGGIAESGSNSNGSYVKFDTEP